jgi:regulatory LuxR family protein
LRSRTSPTSRSTRRCLEAPGWAIPSSWANSVTGRSPALSSARISRRCGSAIALKTSDVVAARAMGAIICRYRHASSRRLPTHLSAPGIATELSVSASTVKTHVRNLYAKLGAYTRAEAVESARALSLLAPVRIGAVASSRPLKATGDHDSLAAQPIR